MRTYSDRPRRGTDPGPTWLAWWIMWAVIWFWPLMLGSVAGEVVWALFAGGIAWLAVTGRRRARRKVVS